MFTVPSLNIKVHFAHRKVNYDRISFETVCYITWIGYKGPFIVSYAYCSKEDQFNKEIGRKLALKRALDTDFGLFDKIQRTIIWKAYFSRGKNV